MRITKRTIEKAIKAEGLNPEYFICDIQEFTYIEEKVLELKSDNEDEWDIFERWNGYIDRIVSRIGGDSYSRTYGRNRREVSFGNAALLDRQAHQSNMIDHFGAGAGIDELPEEKEEKAVGIDWKDIGNNEATYNLNVGDKIFNVPENETIMAIRQGYVHLFDDGTAEIITVYLYHDNRYIRHVVDLTPADMAVIREVGK